MKLEKFTKRLEAVYGNNLQSVILYGAAAAGEFGKGRAQYDLMVVFKDIGVEHLTAGSKLIRRWMAQGNPEPLLIDTQHIRTSLDVFPIEFSDMKDNHQVLWGNNPLADIQIKKEDLRLQCEREIKEKILALRERYVALHPSSGKIRRLMLNSLSSLFAIFRGILRIMESEVPVRKRPLLQKLNEKTEFDTAVFERLLANKEGTDKLARNEVLPLFADYLTTLGKVATFIDTL